MRVDRSEPVKVTHIPCGEASESRVVKHEHGACARYRCELAVTVSHRVAAIAEGRGWVGCSTVKASCH